MPFEVLPTSVPTAPVEVAFGVRCGVASPGVRSEVFAPGLLAPLSPGLEPVLAPEVEPFVVEDDGAATASANPPAVRAKAAALTFKAL